MTSEPTRVLFLLDCGSQDAEALRTVAALVGGRPFEVQGLFVEDEDLMGAARLPCVAEVSIHSHEVTPFDPDDASQALAAQAVYVRQIFESSARRNRLTHTFQISRGRTMETLLEASSGRDIVIVGRPLRGGGLRARAGVQFGGLASTANDVLFVNEPWHSGSSIVALCPAGAHQRAIIEKARAIASAEQVQLVLAATQPLAAEVANLADQVVTLADQDEATLIDICQRWNARLLVMSDTDAVDWRELLIGLLDKLSCSLLRVAPAG